MQRTEGGGERQGWERVGPTPRHDAIHGIVLLGALLPSPDDDLADFVVFREPSVFDGPDDRD